MGHGSFLKISFKKNLSQAFCSTTSFEVASHLPHLAGLGVYGRPFFASGRR